MPAKTAARATEGGPSTVSETISARTAARSAGGRPPYPQAITTAARNRRSTAPTSTPRRAKARTVAPGLEDLADVAFGACLQRALHQASVLDAREVRGTALRGDLALQMADVVVLPLDLLDDLVALPEHLEAELDLVLHLEEHVDEGAVGAAQQLDDVVARLEHGAERHRDDRVIAHDRLVHALVGQHVLARGVEHLERRVGDHGGAVGVID